ncbi:MAG: hypothetical protein ACH37Z_14765 [Anaerolineae bacterium]|nr:hypothetical protein [Ardenticatenia bacterium]MBK8541459.1 hypothetical protein [Ardenticatenia bacterium]HQZ71976.1 hypothetical protein [Anaerolineae bacterium]
MTIQQSLQLSFILQNSPMTSGRPTSQAIPTPPPAPAASLEERYARRGLRSMRLRWRPQLA